MTPFRPRLSCLEAHARSAATIIEVLITLGCIGILIALLGPAIQIARESSRRLSCSHHLRQVVLACIEYDSSFQVFPPSTVRYVDRISRNHQTQNLSAHARLLPYLDNAAAFNSINTNETGVGSVNEPVSSALNAALLNHRVAAFECPSDNLVIPGETNYRLCVGVTPGWTRAEFRLELGRSNAEISDGESQTIVFSERLTGDRDKGHYSPARDTALVTARYTIDPDQMAAICTQLVTPTNAHWSWGGGSWLFSGFGNTWYNHVHVPNSRVPDCACGSRMGVVNHTAHAARSFHHGGVNAAFADGSVRFISGSIDLAVWRALGTIDGGEIVPEY